MADLPVLVAENLAPTRDYLREVALVLSALQREFIPKNPREWHYGLEVTMRGPVTQALMINGEEHRGGIDLVRHKVRLDGQHWRLGEYAGPEVLNNVKLWLANKMAKVGLDEPEFGKGPRRYDPEQATQYAETLWWLHKQFQIVKARLKEGVNAPILLYPHHFDLSLVWFPWDDERQISLGWSTGDEYIGEPYIYLTAYPGPKDFLGLELPEPAYMQTKGFSGAILLSNDVATADNPAGLFEAFAGVMQKAKPLLD
jgi:hypothetical protein